MRLLDLFCGAGGSAMGYSRAGFDVVGVDIRLQPHYPFEFHLADAMTYPLEGFDAIHASPPCQHYAPVTRWRGSAADHPDLVPETRNRLVASDIPWVIENVPGAPIRPDFLLCGSAFGLRVKRHRWFETSWSGIQFAIPCSHHRKLLPFMHKGERAYADALGCGWMTNVEAREAIPPEYTRFIGQLLMKHLQEAAA
jgi:hypothetical protein